MSDWARLPLTSFAASEPNAFVDGPFGSDLKVSDYTDAGYRILQLQNVGDGCFLDDNTKFTTEHKALSLSRCLVRPGDLLIAKMSDPLARACIVPPEFSKGLIVADLIKLRPHAFTDKDFLCAAINAPVFRREANRLSTGTTRTRISLSTLKRIALDAPGLSDQQRIGEIARIIDEAIDQTEALIAKTQQIKAGLMHDLFTRGVTKNGELRPPHSEAPQLYKESPLGWIPKEWELAHLASKRAPNRAHLKTGPFGSALKLEHWVEQGRPVITIGALGEGQFIESELLHVSDKTAERLCEYQLEVGDVVFSRVADVGRSAVINEPQEGWIMSSNLMRISLDLHEVNPAYLQAQLAYDPRVRRQIRARLNAGGRDVANSQTLNRLGFAWPPYGEQECVVARLAGIEDLLQVERAYASTLCAQKMGLMHDLLTGRVRVPTNASSTPA